MPECRLASAPTARRPVARPPERCCPPRPRVQLRGGLVKPDPAIYRHVLEQLRCASSDALLVGDTPAADVNGPSDLSSLPRLNRHYTRAAVL
jgi:hypothetical protein